MECNKDEAIKATELAERKLEAQDLAGARRFCAKALQLYPTLERAKQMSAVLEVHLAAQVKCEGGMDDWYKVLQVEQLSDDATIKKQYRRLALLLHPDKNRLAGAEPAFKIVNEAWMILSDRGKKAAYDMKRKRPGETNGYYTSSGAAAATNNSAFHAAYSQAHQPAPQAAQAQGASQQAGDMPTFWTQCPSCKIQYQYYRKFENYQLLCHRCEAGFVAKDIGNPPAESWQPPPSKKHKAANGNAAAAGATNGTHDASTSQVQKPKDKEGRKREEERRRAEKEKEREEKRKLKEALKKAKEEDKRREAMEKQMAKQREREEKEARKKQMEALKKKFRRNRVEEEDDDDDDDDDEDVSDDEKQGEDSPGFPPDVFRFGLRRSSRARKNVIYRDDFDEEDGESRRAAIAQQLEMPEEDREQLNSELAERGKSYVLNVLKMMERRTAEKNFKEQDVKPMEVEKDQSTNNNTNNSEVLTQSFKEPVCITINEEEQEMKGEEHNLYNTVARNDEPDSQSEAASEDCAEEEYTVPDPDFHNFDGDRSQEAIVEGQVWALYDDAEGMPRFYCEIKVVVSVNPFKVRIRWLESYGASAEWEKAGFATTCGQFKCKRRTETEEHFNKFSHLMDVQKQGNVFKIFPKSGEVWAVYSNWTSKWLHHDAEEQGGGVKHLRYEMVEVVSNYFEKTGVTVLPLVKVHGFKTLFARGNMSLRSYEAGELLKFSHKVPAHWMTGREKANAPKDCWELDTAATPLHLIYEER